MSLLGYLKRLWIINKALRMTIRTFRSQQIGTRFWYGMPEKSPYNIGFWIFFKTDQRLHEAQQSGATEQIKTFLIDSMQKLGYPQLAFEPNTLIMDKVYQIVDGEKIKTPIHLDRTTCVTFASDETVKRDFHGNYYDYTR